MTQEVDVHVLAAEASEGALQIPPAGVGLLAFGVLVALLAVAYAFRNVGTRN